MPPDQVGLDDVKRGNSTKFYIVRDYVIMSLVREWVSESVSEISSSYLPPGGGRYEPL